MWLLCLLITYSVRGITSLDDLVLSDLTDMKLTLGAHSFSPRTHTISLDPDNNGSPCFAEYRCVLMAIQRLVLAKPGGTSSKDSLMRGIQGSMDDPELNIRINNEVSKVNISFAKAVVGIIAAQITMNDCNYHACVPEPYRSKVDSQVTYSLRKNKQALLCLMMAKDNESYEVIFPQKGVEAFLAMDLNQTYDQFRTIVNKAKLGVAGTYQQLLRLSNNSKKPMWVHHFFLLQTISNELRVMKKEDLVGYNTDGDFKWETYFKFNWSRKGAGSRLLWRGVYDNDNDTEE